MTQDTHSISGELMHADPSGGLAATTAQVERLTREAVTREPVAIDDDKRRIVIVPDGYRADIVQVTRPQQLDPHPDRRRGTTQHESAASLARYVTEHHDQTATTVWVHVPDGTRGEIVAVLDDHEGGGAGWGEHRAVLPLTTSTEWRYWLGSNNRLLGHVEFAEHLEGGIGEIAEPPAAELLDLIRTIQFTRDVDFVSSAQEGGLINVSFRENEDAKTTNRGDLPIPKAFVLRLPIFPGSAAIEVKVRVRYRMPGGTLQVGYAIDRPESIIEFAVNQLVDELTAALPEPVREHVYRGRPIGSGDNRESVDGWVSTDSIARD